MKSKEDNTDDEGLCTPPSCLLYACGAFVVCDFGRKEGGGGNMYTKQQHYTHRSRGGIGKLSFFLFEMYVRSVQLFIWVIKTSRLGSI